MKVFTKAPGLTADEKILLIDFHRNGGNTWAAPTLENSWVDAGGAWQTARYRKDMWNLVRCEGSVKDGTSNDATVVFTLPVGYRPSAAHQFVAVCDNGGTLDVCYLTVSTNGEVAIYDADNNDRLTFSFTFEATQ